ncbi:EpsG family protein [Empedobacter sp. GD03739]|uniref:EpsG family protein n=1 Tax=Empedobacter sp. GD03739 TaxID=2975376 RepID=UPI00244A39C0|nr:EpsG family protein [Empedobacter sp. GD03739]MDH1601214.1 EpsG family protein [Empedobacter sp. GD03739]
MDIVTYNIIKVFTYIIYCIFIFISILSNKNIKGLSTICVLGFAVIYMFVFGNRDLEIGTDTRSYIENYNKITQGVLSFEKTSDTIFYVLSYINNYIGFSNLNILLFIAFIFMFNVVLFSVKYGKYNSLYILFSFVSCFFFYNLGTNILRQGLAISFFLCSIAFFKNKTLKYLYFILTILSHISSVLIVGVYFLSKYLKIKTGVIIFIISIILSFLKFDFKFIVNQIPFFQRFLKYTDEDGYLASVYDVGFKPKFIVFNLFFLIIGLFIKKYIKFEDDNYDKILITFCLASAIFFLSFNIPFSDRVGVYSWCLIPLIIFPIFSYKFKNMVNYRLAMFFILIIFFFAIQ